jgi:hypothetical protein
MPSGFLGGGIGPVALKRRRAAVATGNGLLNNLIAYWPLNEAGGANNALDLHSNALHLTQVASPGSAAGKVYAGARAFNGSTQYFSRASEALLQTGDVDFTVAAWVYAADVSDTCIIGTDETATPGQREFTLSINGLSKLQLSVYKPTDSGVGVVANSFGSLSANQWRFVVAWHDATADTIDIQIDGGTVDSAATGGALQPAGTTPLMIGRAAASERSAVV